MINYAPSPLLTLPRCLSDLHEIIFFSERENSHNLDLYWYHHKGVYTLGNYVPQILSSCWIAPNAAVIGNVIMDDACSVWFSATIRGDNKEPITIGARTNVKDNAVLHADAGVPMTIGTDVIIGHQAHAPWMYHRGTNSLIGIGCKLYWTNQLLERIDIIGMHIVWYPENTTIPDNSTGGRISRKGW